jgi:hypothetical protein
LQEFKAQEVEFLFFVQRAVDILYEIISSSWSSWHPGAFEGFFLDVGQRWFSPCSSVGLRLIPRSTSGLAKFGSPSY